MIYGNVALSAKIMDAMPMTEYSHRPNLSDWTSTISSWMNRQKHTVDKMWVQKDFYTTSKFMIKWSDGRVATYIIDGNLIKRVSI